MSEAETPSRKLLISKRETAQQLGGLSLRTVDYLISRKELATVRIGSRNLVKYSSLLQFIRSDHGSPSKEVAQ